MAEGGRVVCGVEAIARTQLTFGRVVRAHVDYQDGSGSKVRPAVVTRMVSRHEVEVLPLTTHAAKDDRLAGWEEAGLPRRCGFARHVQVIDRLDVVALIGQLGDWRDQARARQLQVEGEDRRRNR